MEPRDSDPRRSGGAPDGDADTAEERRFLWSLVAMVVVIVVAGAAISAAYLLMSGGR